MEVKIQYTDGTIELVDHTQFYQAIRNKDIFRFAIGSANFYNHDFYALEDKGDHILISMWDLATSYPEQNWTEEGHACVYEVYGPDKWRRTQYGQGSPTPWTSFTLPKNNIKITGVLISDEDAITRITEWPITARDDWSKEGF